MITIPGFDLGEKLYEGSRTLVWRARRRRDGSPVVLKMPKAERPSPSEIARYRREHEITSRLARPHVIRSFELQIVRHRPVLVLDDIGGQSLKRARPPGGFSLDELLRIASTIAEAIGEIHAGNVIHKDINPSNIVLDASTGRLEIIDFGISSVLSRECPIQKSPDVLEGTLAYISPEQTGRMNRVLDYRSDFYSFGATLYELFTGAPPFTGGDALEIVHRHLTQEPVPAHERNSTVPRAISNVIAKLLAKTAEERYQSAWGIKADLDTCRAELCARGRIAPFTLGSQDVPASFQVPQKLYGREREVAALLDAFGRVAGGGREITLVAGYSGIGKTCLVQEIWKPLTRHRGSFIRGKFDQLERNVPYSALVKAFQELVRQLLSESEAMLQGWRERIADALGPNGQVIVSVIPEVELIIGTQPALPELPPMESQRRLHRVFQAFVRVFHRADQPLVIFLDDLQWADAATLGLLRALMSDEDTRGLFCIGAYRDNEVGGDHPLTITIDALLGQGVPVRTISLAPLALGDIANLVADTAHCEVVKALPLAELVQGKTGGNPFFVGQFLSTLHQEGLLVFDTSGGEGRRPHWRWDIARIERLDITDNVIDLMLAKLKRLPAETIDVVRLAACLGDQLDLRTLAVIHQRPASVTYASLFPAIQEGMIVPTSDLEILDPEDGGSSLVFFRYRFLHDRVQQAAYALIDDDAKPELHLRIGRLLLAGVDDAARAARVFEIADHLNLGRALIIEPEEKIELARLDLSAARKAKAAAAYCAARRYLESGLSTFGGDWDGQHALTVALHDEMAEVEYLNGNYERAEQLVETIWERARHDSDRAEAYARLVTQRTVLGKYEEATAAAAKALGLVGMAFPAEAELEAALDAELRAIERGLRNRSIASLIDLPPMTDPAITTAMKVLMTVHTAVYFANRYQLYCWMLARMTNLSIRYGNVPEASKGYASFGNTLAASLGRYQAGYEFGMLGLRLAEKYGHEGLTCKACLILSMFLNHWVRPIAEAEVFDDEGQRAGMKSGELQFVGYLMAYGRTLNRLHRGELLGRILPDLERQIAFTSKHKHNLSTDIMLGARRVIENLTGLTSGPLSFDDEASSEADYLAGCAEHKSFAALCSYQTMKAFALYLAGDLAAARAAIEAATPLVGYIKGVLTEAQHNVYQSLILAASYDGAPADRRPRLREQIEANQRQLQVWADHCPANFRHARLLVEAEMARLSGEVERAMVLYDEAIAAAGDDGFVHHEALANELAARFWLARCKPDFALIHLRRARVCYRAWGATQKDAALAEEQARLTALTPTGPSASAAGSRQHGRDLLTDETSVASLDMASVVKASQAISGEIVLDELLDRLLAVVLENAGAQRGSVILKRDGCLVVVASIAAADRGASFTDAPVETSAELSRLIVQYVARTQQSVVLNDAAREGMFKDDPYVVAGRIRSVLCVPIQHRGDLTGVLYLENNQIAGAFTEGRVELLRILSSQAAISLQNAQLLAREQAARAAAEAAERRAALFAESSKVLTASLDGDEVLRRLAALVVRGLAHWCVIDVVEGDRIRRAAVAHFDPGKKPLLDALLARHPPRRGSPHPAVQVIRTGEPMLLSELSDTVLRRICEDEDHAALIRGLGAQTVLSVPLVARGRVLGALSLGSGDGRYGRADLDMAQEVASRAAIAIDNAELFEDAQRSVRVRDEFLMVASHELRSPLTPLKLQNQLIRRHMESPAFERFPKREVLLTAISRSLTQIDGLIGLVDDLLDVSRIRADRMSLVREPMDLSSLVRATAERYRAVYQSGGGELRFQVASGVRGSWDSARIEQVLTNLLTNAVKYGAGKPIEVTLSIHGGSARIAVRDHGIGIAPEEQDKVFERFERGSSVAHYGGLGLGLYITREIVTAHGGTIRVESAVGRGSVFVVEMPIERAGTGSGGGAGSR
ncbi:High-affnity carbon uptake protein Hat/HatR [Minicystis rosea]|nr:High-affnity carbon uptake protein Hat/HatR [Minicystis rosea]